MGQVKLTTVLLVVFVVAFAVIYFTPKAKILPRPRKEGLEERKVATTADEIIWKNFSDKELGVSFSYPSNIQSLIFIRQEDSLLFTKRTRDFKARASIQYHMVDIVDIENKGYFEGTVDEYIDQSNLLNGARKNTTFKNLPAIYYEITDIQQVPSDIYIFKHNDEIIEIGVLKPSTTDEFEQEIIDRIIESIKLL